MCASDERSPMQEKNAIKLLEEYEERLRARENPDPREYLKRYAGAEKDGFTIQLNLVTLLTVDGLIHRQEAENSNRTTRGQTKAKRVGTERTRGETRACRQQAANETG